jgi:bifunctional non-homologous end joining protein LigD
MEIAGRKVTITNPDKVFFPRIGKTKRDLVHFYLGVADGAIRGVNGRPMALKRFVNGAEGGFFFQKRAPEKRPAWLETVRLSYPSGGVADELVVRDAAQLAWVINQGCIDLNPHLVRAEDLAHPDELRVDLDPVRGVGFPQVRQVALVVREVLDDMGLVGWPKTSGSRGFHIYCRIEPRWSYRDVRRAAVALAREVERRAPDLATSRWWKEERHGVFVDFNQNAGDRTVASAYSVRPTPDARVSTPLDWSEVPTVEPTTFTIDTVPARFAECGDPWAAMDATVGSIERLLALAGEQDALTPAAPRTSGGTGRRRSTMPLIEIARAATEKEAMEGLERWKARHADVWPLLGPSDLLVDGMRGRSAVWYRIRLNLRNVPEADRPPQEPLEVDYDPFAGWTPPWETRSSERG